MEPHILLTQLNDFLFCPASIYFHGLYGSTDGSLYKDRPQIEGTIAHGTVDAGTYGKGKGQYVTGIDVFSEEYGLIGKIDIYDPETLTLTERKKGIKKLYDGQILQLYGQYYCMTEMGYDVEHLSLHSMDDNRTYRIPMPYEDIEMNRKFTKTLNDIRMFDPSGYRQDNPSKCRKCIYSPSCAYGSE